MFLALIKKEYKQFTRNKGNVFMLFLFPIILITVLSAGLKDMMNDSDVFKEDGNSSIVYYTSDENCKYNEGFKQFIDGVEDSISVEFKNTESLDSVKEEVDNYKALAYINVTDNGFDFYSSAKGEKSKTKIFKSILNSVIDKYAAMTTIGEYNPRAFMNFVQNQYDSYLQKTEDDTKDLSSSEYYTFAELGLIILYVSTTVAESVYREKSLTTINRIRLSKVKEGALIASKVFFGTIISLVQTFVVYIYSTFALNVDWGKSTFKFILMFVALGFFVSALGAVLGILANNWEGVSGTLNGIIIAVCFLGGCYCPLQNIISIPVANKLMNLSPTYWINNSVGSLLRDVDSNAYFICLSISICLGVLLMVFYLTVLRRREEIAND